MSLFQYFWRSNVYLFNTNGHRLTSELSDNSIFISCSRFLCLTIIYRYIYLLSNWVTDKDPAKYGMELEESSPHKKCRFSRSMLITLRVYPPVITAMERFTFLMGKFIALNGPWLTSAASEPKLRRIYRRREGGDLQWWLVGQGSKVNSVEVISCTVGMGRFSYHLMSIMWV